VADRSIDQQVAAGGFGVIPNDVEGGLLRVGEAVRSARRVIVIAGEEEFVFASGGSLMWLRLVVFVFY
jgi:hypothetical protein